MKKGKLVSWIVLVVMCVLGTSAFNWINGEPSFLFAIIWGAIAGLLLEPMGFRLFD